MKTITGNLCLLVSYPKSGNTWFRAFYSNYVSDPDSPVHINQFEGSSLLNSRSVFDYYTGVESSNLTTDQIEQLKPDFYRALSKSLSKPLLIKHHDAFPEKGEMPIETIRSVIYLIRNPLDVAVSISCHFEWDIDKTIEFMNNDRCIINQWPDKIFYSLGQKLSSWSGHVTGWTQAPLQRFHLIRYEDMVQNPERTFSQAVPFLELEMDNDRLSKALKFSQLNVLQAQEEKASFVEKGHKGTRFFRKGTIGDGARLLSKQQIRRIVQIHGSTMQRFGYLP